MLWMLRGELMWWLVLLARLMRLLLCSLRRLLGYLLWRLPRRLMGLMLRLLWRRLS